jgi:hypothetical protein
MRFPPKCLNLSEIVSVPCQFPADKSSMSDESLTQGYGYVAMCVVARRLGCLGVGSMDPIGDDTKFWFTIRCRENLPLFRIPTNDCEGVVSSKRVERRM